MVASPDKEKRRPNTRLKDPRLKNLRAVKMLEAKITGKTNAELAVQFNMHRDTVVKTLDYAKRAGLIATFEDSILQSLVPAAVNACAEALANGDTQVALEVLKGTGLLRKPQDKPLQPTNDNESLEIYIRKIRGNPNEQPVSAKPTLLGQLVARPSLAPSGAGDVIDGSVTEVEQHPTAAEAAAGIRGAGDEDRPADPQQRVDLPADAAGRGPE